MEIHPKGCWPVLLPLHSFMDADLGTCAYIVKNPEGYELDIKFSTRWISHFLDIVIHHTETINCFSANGFEVSIRPPWWDWTSSIASNLQTCSKVQVTSSTRHQVCRFECKCPRDSCNEITVRIHSDLHGFQLCEILPCPSFWVAAWNWIRWGKSLWTLSAC